MIKELAILPAFAIMLLTFSVQLVDVAESSSTKALDFTYDMQKAIDCAAKGIDLRECSPNIYSHDFEEEINKSIELNSEITEKLEKFLNNNYEVTQSKDTIVIKLKD